MINFLRNKQNELYKFILHKIFLLLQEQVIVEFVYVQIHISYEDF